MNLTSLRTSLKRYGFNDSDPIDIWLNAAYMEVIDAIDWPFLEASTTIAASVGVNTISLPADFFKLILLRDVTNSNPIEVWSRARFDRDVWDPTSTGQPQAIMLLGLDSAQLWPVLDSSVSFSLIYQKDVAELVNPSDEPIFNQRHHYIIVHRAAAIALMAESEEDRAQAAQTEFDSALGRMLAAYSSRDLGEPDTVLDTQGYGSD